MQAYYLTDELIDKELRLYNYSADQIASLKQETFYRCLKIIQLPLAVMPHLKNVAAEHGAVLIMLPSGERSDYFVDILITATRGQFRALFSSLQNGPEDLTFTGRTVLQKLEQLEKKKAGSIRLGESILPVGERTLIMGILNVTPDSFSDGGNFDSMEKALKQAFKMAEEGADIIDIGGESTRPGHEQISCEEELSRVMPVIEALKKERSFNIPLSIDTSKAAVAKKALLAGVEMLNDVWGLKNDTALGSIAAHYDVPVCLMHNRNNTDYKDLIADILTELEESIDLAHNAGIEDHQIIIDPGIGFGKDLQQNLDLMFHLPVFCNLGYPLLLGTSRKSMIGKTLDLPVDERLEGTAATIACGIGAGIDIVRVHDVKEMKRVAMMTDAMIRR